MFWLLYYQIACELISYKLYENFIQNCYHGLLQPQQAVDIWLPVLRFGNMFVIPIVDILLYYGTMSIPKNNARVCLKDKRISVTSMTFAKICLLFCFFRLGLFSIL